MDNAASTSSSWSQPVSAHAVYKAQNLANGASRPTKRKHNKQNKKLAVQSLNANNVQRNEQSNQQHNNKRSNKKRKTSKSNAGLGTEDNNIQNNKSNKQESNGSKSLHIELHDIEVNSDSEVQSVSAASDEAVEPRGAVKMPSNNHLPAGKPKPMGKKKAAKDPKTFTPITSNSVGVGKKIYDWLLGPVPRRQFMHSSFERKPFFLARNVSNYYNNIISTPMIDDMLRKEYVLYSQHIDVTSYDNGVKELHNPEGRALPHVVWDYYINGCSIRLLNPQAFLPSVHMILATLQEFTGSFVGANVYLTPPSTQGFAPHYDDIEAFILQVEGKKMWRVYEPLSNKEQLPRYSSKDFCQQDLGKPLMEVTLKPGDLLYLPRGFIHQAMATAGHHSLHLTVSMFQRHSYADLLEKVIPQALNDAINDNVDLREVLPLDIHKNFGYTVKETEKNKLCRKNGANKLKMMLRKIVDYIDIDKGVDMIMKQFQACALPPVLTKSEKQVTVFGNYNIMQGNGKVTRQVQLELGTKVRLLRKNILRVISEDGILKVYFYACNPVIHPGPDAEPPFMEVEQCLKTSLVRLIDNYPNYIQIKDLPAVDDDMKLNLCISLWEVACLMTEYPLPIIQR